MPREALKRVPVAGFIAFDHARPDEGNDLHRDLDVRAFNAWLGGDAEHAARRRALDAVLWRYWPPN